MKALQKLIDETHKTAKKKGWWESPRNPLEICALIHTEISEVVEEYRNQEVNVYHIDEFGKPSGVASELADVIIRIFDFAGGYGIPLAQAVRDKMKYNKTRPYKHGNKRY